MRKILILALLLTPFGVFSQEPCGTKPLDSAAFHAQPWIGNSGFLDSVATAHGILRQTQIPRKHHQPGSNSLKATVSEEATYQG